MFAVTGALAAAGVGAVAAVVRATLVRLEVEGLSMVPVLAPGDRVLVLRTRHLAVGDIVAFVEPGESDRIMVKRVTGIEWNAVRVEGDNASVSRDSRHFGPIPLTEVIGRVLWCYRSPHRPDALSAARSASTRFVPDFDEGASHPRAGGGTEVSDQ